MYFDKNQRNLPFSNAVSPASPSLIGLGSHPTSVLLIGWAHGHGRQLQQAGAGDDVSATLKIRQKRFVGATFYVKKKSIEN